jgi:hypothetical protein
MKPGVDPWASWLATLSSAAQAQITGVTRPATVGDDDQQAFTAWEASLTEEARVALRGPAVAVAATPPPKDLRLGLVELHDGQLPVLRVYSSAAALARRLQALQDQDVAVIPFYGKPLKFTKGPQRYLQLPDGNNVIMIPLVKGGPTTILEADLLHDPVYQEDWYIGPAELAYTAGTAELGDDVGDEDQAAAPA